MEEIDPKLESLLKFLADYQSALGTLFGKLMTAGKLADTRELERMLALGCELPTTFTCAPRPILHSMQD
jgi:hypothetical protein